MTWDTFDKLSRGLCEIHIESKDMLDKIISLIFDKAVDEPGFGELYAELCVQLSRMVGWNVILAGKDEDKDMWFWTDDITVETEIAGPYKSREECLEAAASDEEPSLLKRGVQHIALMEVVIAHGKFVKVSKEEEEEEETKIDDYIF